MIDPTKLPAVAPQYDLRDLLEAGCHFGHEASKWHPKMAEWIYVQKDGIHIFDLAKTAQQLQHAYNYLYDLGRKGKTVIFVGTKRQARDVIKEQAKAAGAFFITSRWLGGLLSNWDQVSRSLKRMVDIEEGLPAGKYDGYTKYERLQLEKEKNRLERFFDGLRGMKQLPDALVVIDPRKEKIALAEAEALDVPVLALVDTNADPGKVDLVVPANDDGQSSVRFIVTQLTEAYAKGRAEASKTTAKTNVKATKAE